MILFIEITEHREHSFSFIITRIIKRITCCYLKKKMRLALCKGHAWRHCLIVRPTGMHDDVIDRYQGAHHRQMFERALTSICLFHKVSLLVYGRGSCGGCVYTYLHYIHIYLYHIACDLLYFIIYISNLFPLRKRLKM